jgi:hypothetical protein
MAPAACDLRIAATGGGRDVVLDDLVSPEAAEHAESEGNRWIKAVRLARVDGAAFRDRFTLRGDSLWWFAELYLHKRRTVARALRAVAALERLRDERLIGVEIRCADPVLAAVVRAWGRARAVTVQGGEPPAAASRLQLAARAFFHTASAVADRLRPGARSRRGVPAVVAAFVHTAFWRRDRGEEGYIGPVLRALETRLPTGGLQLVGLGPRTNFRSRQWSHRIAEFGDPAARALPLTPIEAYSSWRELQPSLRVWRERRATLHALLGSPDLRDHAVVHGIDLWPLVREDLAGIAELQFPWSARAMDEAAAALEMLQPGALVTYAEAGGWGRALMLEARRRQVPTAGLQHGFIYRHWLNYLHEPDEMGPSPANPADAGFPTPTQTLLFDDFAAGHLSSAGRFPPQALAVTGSPKLDALAAAAAALGSEGLERVRRDAGVQPGQHLVLVAAKHAQLGAAFRELVDAVRERGDVMLLVKPHPAEDGAPYRQDAAGAANVRVLAAAGDLAPLVAAARVVVTANSTAAIEAMVVDVPALVVALPNNLSPFVEAGAMAGADAGGVRESLSRLLYDEESRARLTAARRAFLARYRIGADGTSAVRSAEAILSLAGSVAGRRP